MTEYIEREAAIEAIMSEPPDAHYPQWYADKIKAIPAADVVPVRHWRWKCNKPCPVCKGDYDEVRKCEECGDWHTENELYDGWCEKCLRETINYDTFFEYCEANKDENYLDTFVMCYLLNCDQDEVPKYPSWEFHHLMVETYKRGIANAKLLGEKFGFLEKCVCFIMEDDGYSGRENYAEWLNKMEVK